jgi:hypothetical protein
MLSAFCFPSCRVRTLALDCVRQLLVWPGLCEPANLPLLQALLAGFAEKGAQPLSEGEWPNASQCMLCTRRPCGYVVLQPQLCSLSRTHLHTHTHLNSRLPNCLLLRVPGPVLQTPPPRWTSGGQSRTAGRTLSNRWAPPRPRPVPNPRLLLECTPSVLPARLPVPMPVAWCIN